MDKKQLRHSPKKTCFVKGVSFSIYNFHILTPLPVNEAYFDIEKGERGLSYRQKKMFFFKFT